MTVGDRLREARALAGLSARALDRLAGKAEGQAALIESRSSDALGGTLLAYSSALGISLDWLIAGKGPEPTEEQVRAAVKAARAKLAGFATERRSVTA